MFTKVGFWSRHHLAHTIWSVVENIIELLNLKVLIVEVMEDHELENDEEVIDKMVDKDVTKKGNNEMDQHQIWTIEQGQEFS